MSNNTSNIIRTAQDIHPDPVCADCAHFMHKVAGGSTWPRGRCVPKADALDKVGFPCCADGEPTSASTPCPNCRAFSLSDSAQAERDEETAFNRSRLAAARARGLMPGAERKAG